MFVEKMVMEIFWAP